MANSRPKTRMFGVCDNKTFYEKCLKPHDILFDTLFLSNLALEPFATQREDERIPTMAYLAWYGRHVMLKPGKPVSRSNVMVASWADLMAPHIAANKIANRDDAADIFKKAVAALIDPTLLPMFTTCTRVDYAGADVDRGAKWDALQGNAHNNYTHDDAMSVLIALATNCLPAFKMEGISRIVHVYLAVLKRGNITEAFSKKIKQAIEHYLQINQLRIDPECCKTFYAIYGQEITDLTIAKINEHLTSILPQHAIRLRLTLSLAAGSGLTALAVTGKAIRIFRDFNWNRIYAMYPDERGAYLIAVSAVGDNIWYGFKKELGNVASTKYKNLCGQGTYDKVNGDTSLRYYAGWTRKPKYQAVIVTLIFDYKTAKAENTTHGTPMSEIELRPEVLEVYNLIIKAPNVYV